MVKQPLSVLPGGYRASEIYSVFIIIIFIIEKPSNRLIGIRNPK